MFEPRPAQRRIGHQLLKEWTRISDVDTHIPKLQNVAHWVALQSQPAKEGTPAGARIVRLLTDLASIVEGHVPTAADIHKLQLRRNDYDPEVIDAAKRLWGGTAELPKPNRTSEIQLRLALSGLLPNDLLLEPIGFKSGKLLLSAGLRISAIQLERLRNLRTLEAVIEPIAISRLTQTTNP
jgi:hypothetical protein